MQQPPHILHQRFSVSHAFLVGIDRYANIRHLSSAVKDVEAIAALLSQPIHGYQVHPPLVDGSFEEILELVESTMSTLVQGDSRVLFYFAGHGIASESEAGEPRGYLLPRDILHNNLQRAIPMKRLLKAFEQLPCRHFLLVLDCCFSGAFRWSDIRTRGPVTAPRKVFKERFDRFVTDPAWQVITSAAYDQKAIDVIEEYALGKREAGSNKHSPFAWHFMEGLKGEADIIPVGQPNGLITATELYLYLRDKVESQTIGLSEELRQTPSFFPLRKHDKGEYCFLSARHPLNLPDYDPNRNPYKGLLAYEATDRELFYGRERVSAQVLEQIAVQPLTVVSGASGTGKSSLVKAGVLPVLEEEGYEIFSMRPGEHPLEALQKSLPDSIETESKKAVLFIDQMEEAITRCYEKQEREAFLQRLQQLVSKATPGIKLILTVRSDFEPQFEESALGEAWKLSRYIVSPFRHEELREVIEQPALQHVLYFDPPGLVDTIANEVLQAPGALPLLSYTLSGLFQEYVRKGMPDNRALTLEYYKKLGGVNGSLRTQADRIFNSLDAGHKTTMRKVLLRMVSKEGGDLASRRVHMEELHYPDPEENLRVNDIIEQLYAARLIVRDKDADGLPFVEPAHDALIKAWSRLWEWIKAFEESLPLRDRLINSLYYYQNQGKQENLLLHEDPRLDQLEAIRKSEDCWLNEQEEVFVKKSVVLREQKKKRRRRNLVAVIIALAGLSIVATVFGFSSRRNAEEARQQARQTKALYLASEAWNMRYEDPTQALRLLQTAQRLSPNLPSVLEKIIPIYNLSDSIRVYKKQIHHQNEVTQALFTPNDEILATIQDSLVRLYSADGIRLFDFEPEGHIGEISLSKDGNLILVACWNNEGYLLDIKGNLIDSFSHEARLTSANFSPLGNFVLTTSDDKTAKLWNASRELVLIIEDTVEIHNGAVSENGQFILTTWGKLFQSRGGAKLWDKEGHFVMDFRHNDLTWNALFLSRDNEILTFSYDGHAKRWDRRGNLLAQYIHRGGLYWASASPDENFFATASQDSTAKVWSRKGALISVLPHGDIVRRVYFSKDGQLILTASEDGTARLWTVAGKLLAVLNNEGAVNNAVFNKKGDKILTCSADGSIKTWNVFSPSPPVLAHQDFVNDAQFSPGDSLLITACDDGIARVWNIEGEHIISFSAGDIISSAVFSPKGDAIAFSSWNSTAEIWNLSNVTHPVFLKHDKAVRSVAFSRDGNLLATSSDDGQVKIWERNGSLKQILQHSSQTKSACFSPNNKEILTSSGNTARIWSLSGDVLKELEHIDNVAIAIFSGDGQKILTGTLTGNVYLWDKDGKSLLTIQHLGSVEGLDFSPSGDFFLAAISIYNNDYLSGKGSGQVFLYDFSGNQIAAYSQNGIVKSVSFSSDGRFFASASWDKTVKIHLTPLGVLDWMDSNIGSLSGTTRMEYEIGNEN